MKKILILLSVIVISGCVTLNEEMLRKVNVIPPKVQTGLVELKAGEIVQQLNGEGQNRGILSNTTIAEAMGKGILSRWESENIIADYAVPGALKRDPEYTMTISGTKNEDGSIIGAVFTGLSLYLIPSSQTLTYDLNIEFVNNQSKKHYNVKAKNAMTSWQQILLLPAIPFSWIGSHHMIQDTADYIYEELRKQGAFENK